jgi:cytochrome c oxidase subunit 2
MNVLKTISKLLVSIAVMLISASAWASEIKDARYNMPSGVTSVSREVYGLHMAAFWICVAIGVVVFGVMFYSLIMHRRSRHPEPAKFHQHVWLEVTWAVIPLLILIVIAIPATKVLFRMDDTRDSEIVIKVTGYQWKWRYEYLNQGISFFSNLSTPMSQRMNLEPKGSHYLQEVDNPLVVPVGEKIRFLVTANDVIHSWWVPDFGIKQDAIPGFIHEAWAVVDKPGIYRGQCAELCGAGHGFMPIVVVAVSKEDFAKWVNKMTQGKVNAATMLPNKAWTKSELIQKGRQIYKENCAACHQAEGNGLKPLYPALAKDHVVLGPAADEIKLVLTGRPGTPMQGFPSFTDEEVASVVTYTRSSFGNNAHDIVQPTDVAQIRKSLGLPEHT